MKLFFRSLFSALTLIAFSAPSFAQSGQYGNEWIDYNSTYYKFKVAKAGIYRISRSTLASAGIPASVAGSNFKLYRDGREVPVYVSAETMGSGDYIEFAGNGATGILDKDLYADPSWQPNPNICLFTDTAAYYLTYDNGAGHLRYQQAANNIPPAPPAAESYNWATSGNYYKNVLIEGPSFDVTLGSPSAANPGNPFFSPSFQNGEGLIAAQIQFGAATSITLAAPNIAAVAIPAIFTTSICNRTYHNLSNVNISVNGNAAGTASSGSSETKIFTSNIPAASLNANNTLSYTQTIQPRGSSTYDVWGIAFAELQYPRNYDVTGLNYFSFKLDASSASKYLEFTGVSGSARLYDLTSRSWYQGDVAAGKTRFYVTPALVERSFVLVVDGTAPSPGSAKTVHFTDYNQSGNQGDYIIVTHNKLMQPVNGVDQIDRYKQYRSSANGGLHKVVVADVTELYDQFAYGYETHPLSVKHFLNYAYDKWMTRPASVNMIGHGLQYEQYSAYYSSPGTATFPIVPIYGNPGSDVDFVNFGSDLSQKLQIGRISVWNGSEVDKYLTKVIAYEDAMKTAIFPTAASELWKKQVIHIAGSQVVDEIQQQLFPTLEEARGVIEDTLEGAKVHSFSSVSTGIGTVTGADSIIKNGLGIITYFGHAYSYGFAYNLPDPATINNLPRIPVFIALGCDVAQMFTPNVQKTLSEQYTLSPNGGAIAMLATDNYGYTDFLHNYLITYYKSIAYNNYGGTVGSHMMKTHNRLFTDFCQGMGPAGNSYFTQIECQLLTGDPALPLFAPALPDYHVNADGISSTPANVTTSLDSFRLRIVSYNLGKAKRDTVQVKIEHRNPSGTITGTRLYTVYNLYNTDTAYLTLPIDKTRDLGLNKYIVTVDANDKYAELSELNNSTEFDLFIYSDNLIPVYPYEFSIVHEQGVTLKASSLNVFRKSGRYVMEIDTTTNFNSPSKLQTTITGAGGVIKWKPAPFVMKDSTVYYWRCAFDSTVNGERIWSGSSFIYLAHGSDGWNQSHYFQYLKNSYNRMGLPESRLFKYGLYDNKLDIFSGPSNSPIDKNQVLWNDNTTWQRANQNNLGMLQIMVIDSVTGETWKHHNPPQPGTWPYGDPTKGYHVTEFMAYDTIGRHAAMHYIDSVPNGDYIMLRSTYYIGTSYNIFANEWKADTQYYGPGKSLYHTVKNLGFTQLDSFNKPMTFVYFVKKGRPASEFQSEYAFVYPNDTVAAHLTFNIKTYDSTGQMNSTIIGPAKKWTRLLWQMHASDGKPQFDTANVKIYGITQSGAETFLYQGPQRDTALDSMIKASIYPKIRLEWHTADDSANTAPQLNYWRVLYTPVPEAALNPALNFAFSDSLQVGQQQLFTVAVENLTPIPMDSMLISYKIINSGGVTSTLPGSPKRYRPLPGNDTLNASISFDPANYPGNNSLFIEVNPNNDQPEQYHPNNLGYLPFNIAVDNRNPLLDVTFDGVHILNNDIVSAKPLIKILLKDENQFLALDDTSLLSIHLTGQKHPSIDLPFDGISCKFIPGTTGPNGKNEATVEINRNFEDDIYTLTVDGKDKSNNGAGTPTGTVTRASYKVAFEVINKPTVTNVLNYPNPFSTATSFIFTITGSQIPSQFKIQILSVTGKVVREITKNELGPLHIGRNITEYKWDGKDQFGQMLGNGVYMYRVATSLNGDAIEHRDSAGDRFFKNGYGKMYIMR